jgi:farnesyl-diphosphate farnesyltransferase
MNLFADATRADAQDLDTAFARRILPSVSRTFAFAIEALPPELAASVRTGYLLCRIADTIEDAPRPAAPVRRVWLTRFAALLTNARIVADGSSRLAEEVACGMRSEGPEIDLVVALPQLLHLLERLGDEEQQAIRRWTAELALGMARFLELAPPGPVRGGSWTTLSSLEELTAYEYYVAGTVGCLLDTLLHLRAGAVPIETRERSRRLAVSFGLGLQGTNIIQDLADDRARGWSYLPEEVARRHGTSTRRLHEPSQRAAAMGAVREMARRSLRHLDDGSEYVLLLPEAEPRIRTFCLWPLLLALRTLERILSSPAVLHERVRIPRAEAVELQVAAQAAVPSTSAIASLYAKERLRLHARLAGGL